MDPLWLVVTLVALALGFVVGFKLQSLRSQKSVSTEHDRLIEEARREATAVREAAEHEAKEIILKEREKVEQEQLSLQQEIKNKERDLSRREGDLKGQKQKIASRENDLKSREK